MDRTSPRQRLSGAATRRSALGVALVLCAGVAALAGTWGVPLTKGFKKAAITPAGDTDSFAVQVATGQTLSVRLTLIRGSLLEPVLTILGPDGNEVPALVQPKRKGIAATLEDVRLTGLYEVVVSGQGPTTGRYSVSTKVKGSRNVSQKGVSIAAREEFVVPFAAAGGATVRFSVRRADPPPTFLRLEDPLGGVVPVPGDALTSRSRSLRGRKITLPDALPFGTFRLVLKGTASDVEGARIKLTTSGPNVRRQRGALPDLEPAITAVVPGEVGIGTPLTVLGTGFTAEKKTPLRLFLGGLELLDAVLEGSGRVTATVPSGVTGRLDVALLNGDGHAPILRDAVLVVPPPIALSITPRRGPAAGGTIVTILGRGFRPTAAVTLAGIPFPENTDVLDDGRIEFTTPPFVQGLQDVAVRDTTGLLGALDDRFEFVPAPAVDAIRPALVPHRASERITIIGRSFSVETVVSVDGTPLDDVTLESGERLAVTLPELAVGPHDLDVRGPFGGGRLLEDGLHAFEFTLGTSLPGAQALLPDTLALGDYDQDGDLDVFLASQGGASRSATSLLTVLRNDGGGSFTDVTASVVPDVIDDDWRAVAIGVGDVAGSGSAAAPDGWPDLVLASLDEDALPDGRSRIRILANQAFPDGSRKFSDRTSTLMAAPTQADDWKTEDIWVGDLDGDGGVADIVATHDAIETFESPLSPFFVYYESGTRVFSFAASSARFAWQPARLPRLIGTRTAVPNLPTCGQGDCQDDFNPFRGRSLALADLDQDGRMDLAVTSPSQLVVLGVNASSTQIGRNVHPNGQLPRFDDLTSLLPTSVNPLAGDIVLFGDLTGDPLPDLAVISRSATAGSPALQLVENRGTGANWILRTSNLIPDPAGEERRQAHDAVLADVDGDRDLDIVLLTDASPDGGRALRILRNEGAAGFTTVLTPLLPPGTTGDDLDGTSLAVGDLDDDGGLGIVIGRPTDSGSGDQTRIVRRQTD